MNIKKLYMFFFISLLTGMANIQSMQWMKEKIWGKQEQLSPQENFEYLLRTNDIEVTVKLMRELLESEEIDLYVNDRHVIDILVNDELFGPQDWGFIIDVERDNIILQKINMLLNTIEVENICQIVGKARYNLEIAPGSERSEELSVLEALLVRPSYFSEDFVEYNENIFLATVTNFIDHGCTIENENLVLMLLQHIFDETETTPFIGKVLTTLLDKKAFSNNIFENHTLFSLLLYYMFSNKNIDTLEYILTEAPSEYFNQKLHKKIAMNIGSVVASQIKPIYLATVLGSPEQIELLIQYGVDIQAQDDNGLTPLHLAVQENNIPVLKLLVNNGADINTQDNEGQTPLHVAASKDHISVIELLLNNGADINARDNDNYSPIELSDTIETFETLYNWGAEVNVDDFKTELLSRIFTFYTVLLYHSKEWKDKDISGLFIFQDEHGRITNFINIAHELFYLIDNDKIETVAQFNEHFGKHAQQLKVYLDIENDKDVNTLKVGIEIFSDEEALEILKNKVINSKKLLFYVQNLP